MFTFGSLFSGIGGLDLGLERAGMSCAWQVENDTFCQEVLQKHWPDVARHGDVRGVGRHNLSKVDLIAGGFPCQPHSLAGDRRASEDERNLWPDFYRVICELTPEWVLGENVVGLRSSENGSFFGQILRDLAQERYDVQWFCVQASAFGAPHQRERIFILAHASSSGREKWQDTERIHNQSDSSGVLENAIDTRCVGTRDISPSQVSRWTQPRWDQSTSGTRRSGESTTPTGQSEPGMGRNTHGFSRGLDGYRWPAGPGQDQHDWEPRRVTQEKKANRSRRLKALGNAVVPQVAQYIGHMIMNEHNPLQG